MATTPTSITRIDPSEYVDKGVIGLPDAPELPALEMQEKFDEIAIDVIIPHINGMAEEVETVVDEVKASVAAEETRAKSVEQALSTMIGAEITRATQAEDALDEKMGDLSDLRTDVKTNLVAAINEAKEADVGLTVVNGLLCCRYATA